MSLPNCANTMLPKPRRVVQLTPALETRVPVVSLYRTWIVSPSRTSSAPLPGSRCVPLVRIRPSASNCRPAVLVKLRPVSVSTTVPPLRTWTVVREETSPAVGFWSPASSTSKTVATAVELQEYSVASRRAQDCWQTPPEMTTA